MTDDILYVFVFLIPLKSNSFKDALSEAIMCMVENESTSKRSMTHFKHLYEKKEGIGKNILSFKIFKHLLALNVFV